MSKNVSLNFHPGTSQKEIHSEICADLLESAPNEDTFCSSAIARDDNCCLPYESQNDKV